MKRALLVFLLVLPAACMPVRRFIGIDDTDNSSPPPSAAVPQDPGTPGTTPPAATAPGTSPSPAEPVIPAPGDATASPEPSGTPAPRGGAFQLRVTARRDAYQTSTQAGTTSVPLSPQDQYFCPLTGMTFEGMGADQHRVTCAIQPQGGSWNLAATTAGFVARLWCSSLCLQAPPPYTMPRSLAASQQSSRGRSTQLLLPTATSICGLRKVSFSGRLSATESAACEVVEKKGKWELAAQYYHPQGQAWTEVPDGGAECEAQCLSWTGGIHGVSSETTLQARVSGTREFASLGAQSRRFCLLTAVTTSGIDNVNERSGCDVYLDQNSWYLEAKVNEASDGLIQCKARCLTW